MQLSSASSKRRSLEAPGGSGTQISLGKLKLAEPFEVLIPRQIETNGIQVLKIEIPHLAALVTLPFHHRDPFDRLFAAQCVTAMLPIVSIDPVFDAYGIQRMW